MEPFLWLMLIVLVGSFFWLFKKVADLKHDTLDEAQSAEIQKIILEANQKKKTELKPEQQKPKQEKNEQKPPLTQDSDSDSGITYE